MSTGMKSRKGDALTEAEAKVVALIAEDLLCKQIADRLGVGVKTVNAHATSAKKKAAKRTLAGLTAWWVTIGKDMPVAPPYVGSPPRPKPRPKAAEPEQPKARKPRRQRALPAQRSPSYYPSMSDYLAARGIA